MVLGNEENCGHGPTIRETGMGHSTEEPARWASYNDNQVAKYIDLYRKMQHAAAILHSSVNLYESSPQEEKVHFKSSIRDFAQSLREAVALVKSEVPKNIQERVSFGSTPDQLESLVVNTLLKVD
jgi:hypothetical protein